MARIRQPIDTRGEFEEVKLRFKTVKQAWKKQRLQTILLLLETEKSFKEISEIVHSHPSWVKKMAKLFREEGLDALLTRKTKNSGRKSICSDEVLEALREQLKEGNFRTARQIEHWLQKQHGITLGENSIYYILKKLGGRLKVPRPSHAKKDEKKEQEFRETLTEKLTDLKLPKDKKLELWVYDEMRYGLHPLLRKMWSLMGHRVIAPVHRRFEWGYLFGAMNVSNGKSEFLHTGRVTKVFDRAFLEQIAKSDPDAMHVVIGDGAGFHHREGVKQENPLPENLRIITIPPYCPELNPAEKLWDVIKDEICTTCWDTLSDLEQKIDEILKSLWERPGRLRSFFTNSYLRSELNAI